MTPELFAMIAVPTLVIIVLCLAIAYRNKPSFLANRDTEGALKDALTDTFGETTSLFYKLSRDLKYDPPLERLRRFNRIHQRTEYVAITNAGDVYQSKWLISNHGLVLSGYGELIDRPPEELQAPLTGADVRRMSVQSNGRDVYRVFAVTPLQRAALASGNKHAVYDFIQKEHARLAKRNQRFIERLRKFGRIDWELDSCLDSHSGGFDLSAIHYDDQLRLTACQNDRLRDDLRALVSEDRLTGIALAPLIDIRSLERVKSEILDTDVWRLTLIVNNIDQFWIEIETDA